ncbi:MAG: chemotaxis-specific protein-glutamate methyltransferase CheB [Phycisphaerales bacterium]|jgi:two-component system response regulator WspF
MMRVAIVNDLRLAVEALRRVVASIPEAEVAWVAMDGAEAVRRCHEDRPDVVLMDLLMPVMNGVESTRRIMTECPCPILVVTATVDGNSLLVYDALGHGALDAVNTPTIGTGGDMSGAAALVRKIEQVRRLSEFETASSKSISGVSAAGANAGVASGRSSPPILAIGASTGGPQALATVLAQLPRDFDWPVLVVQHVDAEFVGGLATWLGEKVGRRVSVAGSGVPRPGEVAIAGSDRHLIMEPDGRLATVTEPSNVLHRPSVDVMFSSLARNPGSTGVAVLLTGMGRDGAAGLLELHRAGWSTIAQDEASSVVWGMPGAAARLGAAQELLPIERIGSRVADLWRAHRTG